MSPIDRFSPESYEDYISRGRTVQQVHERISREREQVLVEAIADLRCQLIDAEPGRGRDELVWMRQQYEDELAELRRVLSERDNDDNWRDAR